MNPAPIPADARPLRSALAAAAQELMDRDEAVRQELAAGEGRLAETEKEGKTASEELNQARGAVKLLGGKIENAVSFELPKTEGERTLVVIRKVEATAKKYPRKAGMPGKEPLK